jgi:hypothetical protein
LPPSNPSKQPHFQPYADMGRDKAELKAAAGVGGNKNDPSQKIYKGHTFLKHANKSVTVRMDDAHQRRPAAQQPAGIPIPNRNAQQPKR